MINLELSIEGMTDEELERYREIVIALIQSGGLSGVKAGKTIIHFDAEGLFQGVELDYWPWRRRKKELEFRKNVHNY